MVPANRWQNGPFRQVTLESSKCTDADVETPQTLMSTDIFQDKEAAHPGPNPFSTLSPLQVYLAASLPLTFVTLMIWASFHWVERNKERMRSLVSQAKRASASQLLSPV